MKGNQGTVRAINRRSVLRRLRNEPGLSRAELASRTGLSRAAITDMVAELIEEGLLAEGEAHRGMPGRRPIPLNIRYESRLAVGIRITLRELECVLTDLSTRVIEVVREPLRSNRPVAVVDAAARVVERLEPRAEALGARITGVGIGLPGAVQAETGKVLRSFRFGWRNVPMARMLSERVRVPVWIDDDMHAYALNQQLFGVGKKHATAAVVAVGEGIACASIIEGRVRRGAHGAAGKIGHVVLDSSGPQCECGRTGCLQSYFALPALEVRWKAASGGATTLAEAARIREPGALAILEEAGAGIGRVVATFLNVLDPSVLVLAGEATALGSPLIDPMRAVIDERSLSGVVKTVIDWEDQSWARGAAALATQSLFDFEAFGGIDRRKNLTRE